MNFSFVIIFCLCINIFDCVWISILLECIAMKISFWLKVIKKCHFQHPHKINGDLRCDKNVWCSSLKGPIVEETT